MAGVPRLQGQQPGSSRTVLEAAPQAGVLRVCSLVLELSMAEAQVGPAEGGVHGMYSLPVDPLRSASSGRVQGGTVAEAVEARGAHGSVPQMPRGAGTVRRWPQNTARRQPCWQQSQPKPGWPRWRGLRNRSSQRSSL